MRHLKMTMMSCMLSGLAMFPALVSAQPGKAVRLPSASDTIEDLSSQDREILDWANGMTGEITTILERWISTSEVSEDRLFSLLYYPIPKTDPAKYTTDYHLLSDRDVSPILEKYLTKSESLLYAVLADINGYVPTHNKKYTLPLTGNRAVDLVNNRTKRLFGDRTGVAAAKNEAPYLLQIYKRDTGELMADLSVPVMIKGKHWGCVRFGYRRVDRR